MNAITGVLATLTASLYFQNGSTSDKEYHAEVIEKNGGYVVNFRYGRRGSSLTSGTKTASPVSLEQANKVFSKLVAEKMAKGYTPSGNGTAYQATPDEKKVSGLLPQLLNPVTVDEAKQLIGDARFFAQEKKDGKRIMIRVQNGIVTANNRKGLVVAIPKQLADDLSALPDDCVLDGELIGEVFHVFDCLETCSRDIRSDTAADRLHSVFFQIEHLIVNKAGSVKYVSAEFTSEGKQRLFDSVKAAKGEGIVFKLMSASYTVGRPNSGGTQLKHKFTESASCIVSTVHPTKRSIGVVVLDNGIEVSVGNVTIPPNYSIPQVGDIVEVEYLYAVACLFQPVFKGVRDDISREACQKAQLKYKPTNSDEDDA